MAAEWSWSEDDAAELARCERGDDARYGSWLSLKLRAAVEELRRREARCKSCCAPCLCACHRADAPPAEVPAVSAGDPHALCSACGHAWFSHTSFVEHGSKCKGLPLRRSDPLRCGCQRFALAVPAVEVVGGVDSAIARAQAAVEDVAAGRVEDLSIVRDGNSSGRFVRNGWSMNAPAEVPAASSGPELGGMQAGLGKCWCGEKRGHMGWLNCVPADDPLLRLTLPNLASAEPAPAAGPGEGVSSPECIELWDAVNAYAESCGGNTSSATISGRRMDAVSRVSMAVSRLRALNAQEKRRG